MHIETLKTFCDLVETGSFSKAAALNLVSQSAVSQQVRALEQRFDQQLIERGHRKGVVPTEAGRHLYAECKELLGRFHALDARLRARSEVISGTVRIATVYSVGLHELPPYVKQFIKAHPQVHVHVEYSRTDQGKRIINLGITGLEVEHLEQISLIQSRFEAFGLDPAFERLFLL